MPEAEDLPAVGIAASGLEINSAIFSASIQKSFSRVIESPKERT
jgi:hypothetical protein